MNFGCSTWASEQASVGQVGRPELNREFNRDNGSLYSGDLGDRPGVGRPAPERPMAKISDEEFQLILSVGVLGGRWSPVGRLVNRKF